MNIQPHSFFQERDMDAANMGDPANIRAQAQFALAGLIDDLLVTAVNDPEEFREIAKEYRSYCTMFRRFNAAMQQMWRVTDEPFPFDV